MQSASPSRLSGLRPRLATLRPSWSTAVSATGVLLLTLAISGSTVQADWVPGSDVIVRVALVGAVIMGLLALARFVPWPLALAAGLLLAPIAAYAAAGPALASAHPHDPVDPLGFAATWWGRGLDGSAGVGLAFLPLPPAPPFLA